MFIHIAVVHVVLLDLLRLCLVVRCNVSASFAWSGAWFKVRKMAGTRADWEALWTRLTRVGWRNDHGLAGCHLQPYYLPPGITRCKPTKNRIDYFDSRLQVVRYLEGRGCAGSACSGCQVCSVDWPGAAASVVLPPVVGSDELPNLNTQGLADDGAQHVEPGVAGAAPSTAGAQVAHTVVPTESAVGSAPCSAGAAEHVGAHDDGPQACDAVRGQGGDCHGSICRGSCEAATCAGVVASKVGIESDADGAAASSTHVASTQIPASTASEKPGILGTLSVLLSVAEA